MVSKILKKIFGSRNERLVKRMAKDVTKINELEAGVQALSDKELSAKKVEVRERLNSGGTLNGLLF